MEKLFVQDVIMKIGELCTRNTFIIQKDDNVIEAAKLMRVFNVGDLIVVTANREGNTPIGIVTDRDIVVNVVADSADIQNVFVPGVFLDDIDVRSIVTVDTG